MRTKVIISIIAVVSLMWIMMSPAQAFAETQDPNEPEDFFDMSIEELSVKIEQMTETT